MKRNITIHSTRYLCEITTDETGPAPKWIGTCPAVPEIRVESDSFTGVDQALYTALRQRAGQTSTERTSEVVTPVEAAEAPQSVTEPAPEPEVTPEAEEAPESLPESPEAQTLPDVAEADARPESPPTPAQNRRPKKTRRGKPIHRPQQPDQD